MDEEAWIAQGWRRCALGQKTTQWCAQAEAQRLEDEELLAMALHALRAARREIDLMRFSLDILLKSEEGKRSAHFLWESIAALERRLQQPAREDAK